MKHASLFSGIGGFDLAAEWMGWENIFHCEQNPFCQTVLKHHFPDSICHGDITKTDFTPYANKIDILTGGFPCQPFSVAGKQLGTKDERHLWPEMLRAIREISPRWVVGENVRGLVNWSEGLVFDEVQSDLEAEGYEVLPFLLPAVGVNAPHRRDRIWFVAHATGNRREWKGQQSRLNSARELARGFERLGLHESTTNPGSSRREELDLSSFATRTRHSTWVHNEKLQTSFETGQEYTWQNFPTQSPLCNGNDGISSELDGIAFSKWRNESIKAGGNAIVPQVVYQIFKAIKENDRLPNTTRI